MCYRGRQPVFCLAGDDQLRDLPDGETRPRRATAEQQIESKHCENKDPELRASAAEGESGGGRRGASWGRERELWGQRDAFFTSFLHLQPGSPPSPPAESHPGLSTALRPDSRRQLSQGEKVVPTISVTNAASMYQALSTSSSPSSSCSNTVSPLDTYHSHG